jgi:hypothetical protein
MAETDYSLQIAVIRDRLVERAAQNSPQWHMPLTPVSCANAGCLIVGQLLDKIPAEDASALACALVSEQNEDGSWSLQPGGEGDLALTLEAVQALSMSKSAPKVDALHKAVLWLEIHRSDLQIRPDTLYLLGVVTDTPPPTAESFRLRLKKVLHRVKSYLQPQSDPLSYQPMLDVLTKPKNAALGKSHDLLRMQRGDGSWNGSTRSTV